MTFGTTLVLFLNGVSQGDLSVRECDFFRWMSVPDVSTVDSFFILRVKESKRKSCGKVCCVGVVDGRWGVCVAS